MYKFIVIVAGVMFINFNMHADSEKKETTSRIMKTTDDYIKEVLPDDYQVYERNFKKDNSIEDVQSLFNLLDKVKGLLIKYPSEASMEKYHLQDADRWLWHKILTVWGNSKDENVKNSIKSSWDKCLKEDDASLIPLQIVALQSLNEKNSSFLDDNLWRLFESSNEKMVVCAICQVIMHIDNNDIEKKLINKSEQTDNQEIKNFILNVLSWRKNRIIDEKFKKKNPTLSGRAATPPSIETFLLPNSRKNTPPPPPQEVCPITLTKIFKKDSEDKKNWVIQFEVSEKGKSRTRFMKIGDTVSDYEIKDLAIENLKEGDKEITVYRMTVNNKNTNKEEFFERKK